MSKRLKNEFRAVEEGFADLEPIRPKTREVLDRVKGQLGGVVRKLRLERAYVNRFRPNAVAPRDRLRDRRLPERAERVAARCAWLETLERLAEEDRQLATRGTSAGGAHG